MLRKLQVTTDSDPEIRLLVYNLPGFPLHVVTVTVITESEAHDFALMYAGRHRPFLKPLNYLV